MKVIGVVINVLFPVTAGFIMFFAYFTVYHDGKDKQYYSLKRAQNYVIVTSVFFDVVSGIFLLYAVFIIRSHLRNGLQSCQINGRNLGLHAACFLIYVISLIVEQVFYILNVEEKVNGWQEYLTSVLVGLILSFAS